MTRPFGPYTSSMKWANPNINAAINSFIQVHYSLLKYQIASEVIRSNAIKLLSPSSTGNKMNNRLSVIAYCLCFLHKSQPYYLYSNKCDSSIEKTIQRKYSVIENEYQKYQQFNNPNNNLNKNPNKNSYGTKINLNRQSNQNIQKFCEEQVLGKRVLYERYKRLK